MIVFILVFYSCRRLKGKVTTLLTVCPLRAKPDDSSEMVSQLLFGECAEVIGQYKHNWTQIKCEYDGYVGWIDTKQIIPEKERTNGDTALGFEIIENVFGDEYSTWITLGGELADFDGILGKVGGKVFRYSGQVLKVDQLEANGELIEKIARRLLNAPYLWGGRTPLGIDCSGFTQLIYKCIGIPLLRDSVDQATAGQTIDFVSASLPGDLAFFTQSTDKISHVGIVLPDMHIIHASGKVRIDKMDHYGIFNGDIQEYTHRLKIIKRYF